VSGGTANQSWLTPKEVAELVVTPAAGAPPGAVQFELDGVEYVTANAGHGRVIGWYYGYPACCVEHFDDMDYPIEPGPRVLHPVSGHVLCPACVAGPLAPLPERPADRFGLGWPDWPDWSDDEAPLWLRLTPPSPYDFVGEGS
jgi:hypothetical protein